jgi:sensor c-di-GMP phosphodiesterase-like protein
VLDRLAEAGIPVSIDDYGSGLSSLAYLKQIRADELKIDKAFVMTLEPAARTPCWSSRPSTWPTAWA